MGKPFPAKASETRELSLRLVAHLRDRLKDTHTRKQWTERNLDALRSFRSAGHKLKHFPPKGSYGKGGFLWDYVAYQQGHGILITAETEYLRKHASLTEDFDKLLYARSPIKVFMFWQHKSKGSPDKVVKKLRNHMKSCSQYAPGEIFILYCRTWRNEDRSSGDLAWYLQIPGEPSMNNVEGNFESLA